MTARAARKISCNFAASGLFPARPGKEAESGAPK
jgi:hypothetical protein